MEIVHDTGQKQFYLDLEGGRATLSYSRVDETTLDLYSTYVPAAQRGRGIGARLARHALEYAKEHGYQVVPSCWFVRDYIDLETKYKSLLR